MKRILFILIFFNGYFQTMAQEIKIRYFHNFASIKGFSQIPKGGQYGTTSIEEPTFEQLGIDHINYSKLLLEFPFEKWGVYIEIKNNQFKGKSDLEKDIKTHDIFFPSNTRIDSKHKYNFYNIGLKYVIYKEQKIEISPKIEFSLFDFKYSFSAENLDKGISISNDTRNFKAGGVRIGGEFEYTINDKFKLTSNIMTHMPYGKRQKSLEANLVLSQNIYKNNNKEINLLYGIGYDFLEFKDSQQDMQNYMRYEMLPIGMIGAEYKF